MLKEDIETKATPVLQLTLLCQSCLIRKIFHGEDLEKLIKAIDESDWTDKPDHGKFPHGYMPGLCPDCNPEKGLQPDRDRAPSGHDYGFESSKRRLLKSRI